MIGPESGFSPPLEKNSQPLRLRDGVTIQTCHFMPATNQAEQLHPLILIHGFAEHMGRYDHVAQLLISIGYDVWAYDARGHGVSEGPRGVMPTDDALVDDLIEVFQHVAQQSGLTPVIVGHSMGGLTAALAVALKGLKPAALVLSSPALRVKLSWSQKILLKVGLLVFKDSALEAGAVDESALSHDQDVGLAYRHDKNVHSKISPRMANYMFVGGQRLMSSASGFGVPTLLMYAGEDRIVDSSGSDDLAAKFKDLEVKRYDGAYHEIFNESEPMRCLILTDLADWLKKREFILKFP